MINTLTHVLVNFGVKTLSNRKHFSFNIEDEKEEVSDFRGITDKDLCIGWMYMFRSCPAAAFKFFADIRTSIGSKTLQLGIHYSNMKPPQFLRWG